MQINIIFDEEYRRSKRKSREPTSKYQVIFKYDFSGHLNIELWVGEHKNTRLEKCKWGKGHV